MEQFIHYMRHTKCQAKADSTFHRGYSMNQITAEDCTRISRFQAGDQGAFDELVRRHQRRAYLYAYRLTKNSDEAADVVANAFVRVYRSLEGFKGESSFTTWLYRIETNCFLDMRKKYRSHPSISLDEAMESGDGQVAMQVIDEAESAHDRVERGERLQTIESALSNLPEHQRAILVMYHAESMSYEDIAASLRLPIGTVKSRINRARLSLREVLRPYKGLFVQKKRRPQDLATA